MYDDTYKQYMASISRYKSLSTEDEISVCVKIKEGDKKAREDLINSNLKLVVKIAMTYCKNADNLLMDAIQIGNIALIKAVDNFDINMGYKFSTFAYHYISKILMAELAPISYSMRLPDYAHWEFLRFKSVYDDMAKYTSPTVNELMSITELTQEKVLDYLNIINGTLSLDAESSMPEVDALVDVVCDPNDIIEKTENDIARKEVLDLLFKKMSKREALFIKKYYGLDGYIPKTLQEIGDEFGLTRERVRQIISKPIRKFNKDLALKKQILPLLSG